MSLQVVGGCILCSSHVYLSEVVCRHVVSCTDGKEFIYNELTVYWINSISRSQFYWNV